MAYYCAGAQGTPHLCPREDNYPQATELSLKFERHEEQSGTTPALSHFCLAALPSAGFRIFTFIPRKFSDCFCPNKQCFFPMCLDLALEC